MDKKENDLSVISMHDEIQNRLEIDMDYRNKSLPILTNPLDKINWVELSRGYGDYRGVGDRGINLIKEGDDYVYRTEIQEMFSPKMSEGFLLKKYTLNYLLIENSFKTYVEKPMTTMTNKKRVIASWDNVFRRYGTLKLDHTKGGYNNFLEDQKISYYAYHPPVKEIKIFFTIYVEIKPKIISSGEVMRQLKRYEINEPLSVGNIYLVTPDARFDEVFKSQGIHIVHC